MRSTGTSQSQSQSAKPPLIRWIGALALVLGLLNVTPPAAAKSGKLIKGGKSTVVSVVDGDTVVLDPPINLANQVRLVGIQAPKLPLNRPNFKKWPLADDSKLLLEQLALGKRVTLSYGGRRMDRHGRLLAHLHLDDGTWLQGELLRHGMARVYSFSDNRKMVPQMLALEGQARRRRAGIWRHPYYKILNVESAGRRANTFQLVEGKILDVAIVRGRAYLNFGANWRSDFTISIRPRSVRLFRKMKIDLKSLKGRNIRVRGWLKIYNGPMIEATHPEQIEVLDK
jgi:endonuclease YncB( thermonuclease family)